MPKGLLIAALAATLALAVSAVAVRPDFRGGVSTERARQIEEDWLKQEAARAPMRTADDAYGGCDGVRTGSWGFHTGHDSDPWWQVDLGEVLPLDRVVIFNRCDAADRANDIVVRVSDDGRAWRDVYAHQGGTFYGATDGKPLVVALGGAAARFVRVALPGGPRFLHLDEVEVYASARPAENVALRRPADQSSLSAWSVRHNPVGPGGVPPIGETVQRGRRLLVDLRNMGAPVEREAEALEAAARMAERLPPNAPEEARRAAYFRVRWAIRRLAFANPLLSFGDLLFVKRQPGSFNHMSDQNYGWWSRPGGGLFTLSGWREDRPVARSLTADMPVGSFMSPDISYDGTRVLFAYCRFYPHVAGIENKVAKENIPEDAFYHLYEVPLRGGRPTRLTHGRYDDFDGRYLPDGGIVFLSTRRGQYMQGTPVQGAQTLRADLPDSYVRCGGDNLRPVAVYTLHRMDRGGTNLRPLSPFESFEWHPSVAPDGRILYARWDYVDRSNMPYMSLWSMNADGTNPQVVYGNYTVNPHCIFEARVVPNSQRILFTASAHHAQTGGSLVMLDPGKGLDGLEPLERLTPEVCFPETEGWPSSYYATPYPLSENYYLCAWSNAPLTSGGDALFANSLGIYLRDRFGNMELIYRDPEIGCVSPLPMAPRRLPGVHPTLPAADPVLEGRLALTDVYQGLPGVERGTVKRLRVVAMPAKTQPVMNYPVLGMTTDDPGKCVLGTVPVESDGSAYFRVPAGVSVFVQALDADGVAIQTMRSLTCVQPGQTLSCGGCHEPRNKAPVNRRPLAVSREPSRITPGPEGSWPYRYDRLVQPVLDRSCVSCHSPTGADERARRLDLRAASSYKALVDYGQPSLREHVMSRYVGGRSIAEQGAAATSPLWRLLRAPGGHQGVRLSPDDAERLVTWMDTYAQVLGSFSSEQERALEAYRERWAGLLEPRAPTLTSGADQSATATR
ncbi:MAG TPA: discoidin domain-containing protein [Chthonomonadales bacterium]|nr:discoidin domain-containing protein [Chthonomonadales bacterium]